MNLPHSTYYDHLRRFSLCTNTWRKIKIDRLFISDRQRPVEHDRGLLEYFCFFSGSGQQYSIYKWKFSNLWNRKMELKRQRRNHNMSVRWNQAFLSSSCNGKSKLNLANFFSASWLRFTRLELHFTFLVYFVSICYLLFKRILIIIVATLRCDYSYTGWRKSTEKETFLEHDLFTLGITHTFKK